MITWGALAVALQAMSSEAPSPDSLLALAEREPTAALTELALRHSAGVREAVFTGLRRNVQSSSTTDAVRSLEVARRLAAAHASAWSDPFLSRQVELFEARSPEWRRDKLVADSLRRAGAATFRESGTRLAIEIWRESLHLSSALGDTAAMGAAAQNLGAAFLEEGALDSAEVYLERGRGFAVSAGDRVVEGNALGALHFVSFDRGDLVDARELLEAAMNVRRRVGDTRGAAADLNSLGLLAWEVGDLERARLEFQRAFELNRSEGRAEIAATNQTNLAALAGLEGDFEQALALYEEALETYRSAEAWPDVADVLWALGQLEARRGDYRRARSAYEEALSIYEQTGPASEAVSLRQELAGVLTAMGEVQQAIDQLRNAEGEAASWDVPERVRAGAALARADLFVALNTLDEAEGQYRLAERLYADAGDVAGQAEARQGQGLILVEREDYPRAAQVLAGAARVQAANNNARGAALTRILLAEAQRMGGDEGDARELLLGAVAELHQLSDPVGEAFALAALGDLHAEAGRPLAADSAYAAALGLIDGRPASEVRWRLHVGRAQVARADGGLDVAARELRAAIEEIERTSWGLKVAEKRSAYRADKVDVYAQLALVERMRGRITASFEVAERMRAREMLELMAQGRMAPPSGIPGDLAEREQDLRMRIAELTRELEPLEPASEAIRGPTSPERSSVGLESLSRARDEYADLLLEVRERAPRQADLLAPRPADWRDVARRLTSGSALVEYLLTDSGSVAFVVTPDTLAVVDLGVRRSDLARLLEFSRALIEQSPRAPEAPWRGPLRRLHEYLVTPVEDTGLLVGVDRLVLVPHAELHYLPFAALVGPDGSYLVERYVIGLTPSASVWLTLGDRSRASGRGVLALVPRPDALPASRREAAAVVRFAGRGAAVLSGPDASEAALRRLAGDYGVLHLATFGLLNTRNPLFSSVDLAPGRGHDGRLEVHEVFGLELSAELVVLSACQTALGSGSLADVPEGDDWVGLTRAFLHAGARRVVATLWAVEDEATAQLMERFYEARASGHDDAAALAEAQRAMLRRQTSAHPFHWAGVVLVGQQEGADAR